MNIDWNIIIALIIAIANVLTVYWVWRNKHNDPMGCILCLKKHFNHHRKKAIKTFYESRKKQFEKYNEIEKIKVYRVDGDSKRPEIKENDYVYDGFDYWYWKWAKSFKDKNQFELTRKKHLKDWDIKNFWKICSDECIVLYLFDGYQYEWNSGRLFSLTALEVKKESTKTQIKKNMKESKYNW